MTFTCEPTKLLPWLMKKFEKMNGKILKRKIMDLKELHREGFNVVVNCTGIGSKTLASDNAIIPVRGQVSRVNINDFYYYHYYFFFKRLNIFNLKISGIQSMDL